MSGRFPKAPDVAAFWENLANARDCIAPVDPERWARALGRGPDGPRAKTRWGGWLDRVDHFDPLFFNISVREAERMDPQQRLALEVVWSTLENAGYGQRQAHAGRSIGVYLGSMWGEYSLYAAEQGYLAGDWGGPGSLAWAIPNRVSYAMGFTGPSIAVDTACSSSLSALHLAAQGLRDGDCEMAVVGGVNLSLHPAKYDYLSEGRFLSSDGRCRSFGEGGDGYVPGEGVAAVLLKPLEAALADGDRIDGVLLGTAINHGGAAAGFTAPNPRAQQALITEALSRAGLRADDLDYVECHGTGTALGDPIEIEALGAALSERAQPLAIGSVKSNVGHLEAAAGMAGLAKLILSLRHETLPASLHGSPSNPAIAFDKTPFELVETARPWPRTENRPRIAALSSFGAGGSNAHVVITGPEFAGTPESTTASDAPQALCLSARSKVSLATLCAAMADALDRQAWPLEHVAATLRRRASFGDRAAIVADTPEGAARILRETAEALRADRALQAPEETGDAGAIARAWLAGEDLPPPPICPPCDLPGTPFEDEPLWLPTIASPSDETRTTSQFLANSREIIIAADEPRLADHTIGGAPLLAAAVGLEMLREFSGAQAFTDLTWLRPVTAPQRCT
ncbi:polyketide synthase [Breoghania sp. L-A4]|uniref:beta-ketoacyl synthase N-terminal-like domain-containing protein n=1 Tax=Breoghania sp. L-A4 TaxID=2304600 RepID=UPI0013C2EBBF|nr:polyketide synthase [Breoghania sp. L-A4]